MRKKNYKGRCVKKYVSKSKDICHTYDEIQLSYYYSELFHRANYSETYHVPLLWALSSKRKAHEGFLYYGF